ncbi:hypothetical protein MMC26_003981 [Xylographa opegraphella]|nr:hypothetical protein [Xylographa opegraphella]
MARKLSFSCRGKGQSISEDALFQYSNGWFLLDEKQQFLKRRVNFDVRKLCDLVASLTKNGASVCKIDKMEGGFSKTLLITTEDGMEVVAKIPCPNVGKAKYSTASEAAVLQYVSSHTTIPVPKILAWNADPSNPIGAEYIIMEKASGIQLFKVWDDIPEADRLKLIKGLTQLENKFTAIRFPAYGSLYFRHSISKASERILLDSAVDPTGLFCIGPACGPAWTDGISPADIQPDIDAELIQRSIARTRLRPAGNIIPVLHGKVQDHASILNATENLLPTLTKHPPSLERSRPTMWHTDLHMGNIFVSQEDHTRVVCLIDWQSTSISPLFLQARWPAFLSPAEGYSEGPEHPKLPGNFDDLDADEKNIALFEKDRAVSAKAYEVATYLNNHDAYTARWEIFDPLREYFSRIGDTWDDGVVPLRTCLIRLVEDWEQIGFPDTCPIHFISAEIASHEKRLSEYAQWHEIQDFAWKYLDTDAEGWVPPEADWAEKRLQNKALLELMIERLESRKPEEVRRMWPFPV